MLIKHEMSLFANQAEPDHNKWNPRDIEFYSLYMHLDPASHQDDVPWLHSFLPFLERNVSSNRTVARINVAEDTVGQQKGLNCRKAPTERNGRWVPGDLIRLLPLGTIVELLDGQHGHWQQISVPALSISSAWVHSMGNRLVEIPEFNRQVDALFGP